jgi:hypothetical protein
MDEGQVGQMRARGDNRQGARRPPASGPRRMMQVGIGAQS